ncbi:MAG: hypothetical protein U1F23_07585 [Lysobacterales bacterium]
MKLPTALALLLAAFATAPAGHAAERILTDGFDPCCTLGGETAGLAPGASTMLHLAAGSLTEDLTLTRNGPWQFAAALDPGTAFTLTVSQQPQGQQCTVTPGSGTIGATSDFGAVVACGANLIWDQGHWGEDWN